MRGQGEEAEDGERDGAGAGGAGVSVSPMAAADWGTVQAIFAEGIATGDATLDVTAPDAAEFDERFRADCRLTARNREEIVGWVALAPVSRRQVYAGVAEVSVYVSATARGAGVGRTLLEAVIEASEEAGLWTLQASILAENRVSLGLHESCGFRRVGTRERIGHRLGRWRDVVLLERRSERVGE